MFHKSVTSIISSYSSWCKNFPCTLVLWLLEVKVHLISLSVDVHYSESSDCSPLTRGVAENYNKNSSQPELIHVCYLSWQTASNLVLLDIVRSIATMSFPTSQSSLLLLFSTSFECLPCRARMRAVDPGVTKTFRVSLRLISHLRPLTVANIS